MAEADPLDELRNFVELLARSTADVTGLTERIGELGRTLAESMNTIEDAAASLKSALGDGHDRLETGLTHIASQLQGLGELASGNAPSEISALRARCVDVSDAVAAEVTTATDKLRSGARDIDAASTRLTGEAAGLAEAVGVDEQVEGALRDLGTTIADIEGALRASVEQSDGTADTLGTVLETALPEVLASAFNGFGEALAEQLGEGAADPIAALEESATALVRDAEEASLTLVSHCLDVGPKRVTDSPSHWAPTLDEVHGASHDAIDDGGQTLRRQLEELVAELEQGLATATAWSPLLPQLPQAREAAERIQELMDSMNPMQ
jgi:hypothetical protein